jgi:hypothetical protein
VVFSRTARAFIADYINKVFDILTEKDLSVVDLFRVGGGPLGELSYPPSRFTGRRTPDWWMFSAPAQTSVDLAIGLSPAPEIGTFPGRRVPRGAPWGEFDMTLNDWYQNALIDYLRFLVALHRSGAWSGLLSVLHPSWGVRPTLGTGDDVYRSEAAQGTDWGRQMDAYPDQNCVPWCTWSNRASDGATEGALSPVQYLKKLADARGRSWGLMGENASQALTTEMHMMFTDVDQGMMPLGYRGMLWVSYDDLVHGAAEQPTMADTRARMRALTADPDKIRWTD